eukprot:4866311-Amphidinium_carterae.1
MHSSFGRQGSPQRSFGRCANMPGSCGTHPRRVQLSFCGYLGGTPGRPWERLGHSWRDMEYLPSYAVHTASKRSALSTPMRLLSAMRLKGPSRSRRLCSFCQKDWRGTTPFIHPPKEAGVVMKMFAKTEVLHEGLEE